MVTILLNVLFLIIGMALLIKGADWFVEGSSNIAKALKIPSLIIGLTLVSIGTSLPELSVSVTSSLQGAVDMSVGNVVGSNIFNVLVVIGSSALFTPMIVQKNMFKYDIPILIGIYLALILFSFVITPNVISLVEGIIIFICFICYILFLIFRTKKENRENKVFENKENIKISWPKNLIFIVIGVVGIIFGGEFVVTTAKTLAIKFGMSELLVSLTIVAVGTSLPELVTSMVAAKKGENDIAVGNAIGSCIFNILLILGLSSIVSPLTIDSSTLIDVLVMLLSVVLIFIFAIKSYKINKGNGIILISMYVIYLAYIIVRNVNPGLLPF